MKKIVLLLGVVAFVLAFSCSGESKDSKKEEVKDEGIKGDAKMMTEKILLLTELSNEAAADSKLDDNEIKELQAALDEVKKLDEKMDKKREEDEKYKEESSAYEKEHKAEMDKLEEDFMSAFMKLVECEGFENLKME